MSDRFFAAPPIVGERAELSGDEARHLVAVMRAAVGDEVILFDGSGAEFAACIIALGKRTVELAVTDRREVSRELARPVTLAVALPKGDRQKWLVEKATELGVARLVPLVAERGVAQPVESARERLGRTVIEASKQCGRNRLMEIGAPQAAADFFRRASSAAAQCLLAERGGEALENFAGCVANAAELICAVGPEGGFSDAERVAALASGWRPVSLGLGTLRVETAAIALAAWGATSGQTARQIG
jgi:16S rRNA (uracil1498-N3)-methyltransferase